MGKIIEATNRMYKNVFVCKKCHSKMKADPQKVLKGRVKCRKCGKRDFRPLRRK